MVMSEADPGSQPDNVLRPQWKQQPPGPPPGPWPLLRAALPLLAIAGFAGWMVWGEDPKQSDSPYASIAVLTPPRVEFSESLPEAAETGMMDLARGDCQTAAAHFRTAGRRNPDQSKIRMLEGASLLCAGDASAAHGVLEPLSELNAPPALMWWYLAQACLVTGDVGCALDALEASAEVDPRHRERARRQQRQLMVLLSAE